VFLFGSAKSTKSHEAWAKSHRIPYFALPDELEALEAALKRLLKPRTRGLASRRAANGDDGADSDGRLVFRDGAGTKWTVYDRRSRTRRTGVIERRFVNEQGQERPCVIATSEAKSHSVAQLKSQLARAIGMPLR
jgi:hypothetical protein